MVYDFPTVFWFSLLTWYPYFAGGVFKLELFLPEEYPMAAPKVLHTAMNFQL